MKMKNKIINKKRIILVLPILIITGFIIINNINLDQKTIESAGIQVSEQETEKGKIITISAPDELNYENILGHTELSKEVSEEKIHLYHLVDDQKQEIEVEKYDNNNNGLIDYIEWDVPHLSEQTYELIIEITRAEHLDENKEFISDIYEQVSNLDNVWSEPINNNEYVRVSFEMKLNSKRDITIYPRIVSGNPKIEVYEVDGTEKIAEFTNIKNNEYNKIYLTNLISESQDTFDLRVVNGVVEFDYIVDPAPTFVGAGAINQDTVGAVSVAPTCPTHQLNDVLIVSAYNTDGEPMATVTEGWAEIEQLNGGSDDASWWWKRAPGSGTAGPTITGIDDDLYVICYVFRGVITTGDPFEPGFNTRDYLSSSTDTATPETASIRTSSDYVLVVSFYNGNDNRPWESGYPPDTWSDDSDLTQSTGTDARFNVISKAIAAADTEIPQVAIGTLDSIELGAVLTMALIAADDSPPASDSCTPGVGNWDIACADACNWTSALTVNDNITMTGTGTLRLSANMNFANDR